MDPSANPPQPQSEAPRPQRPGHRDMMFCHECNDEWYRDEHGLTCPECGSDFTEIIEEGNDPRDSHMMDHDHESDNGSLPGFDGPPPLLPFFQPNPMRGADDPAEEDISSLQFRQVAPGRFTVTGTVYRDVSPMGRPAPAPPTENAGSQAPRALGGLTNFLTNIIGGALRGPQQQQQPQQQQPPGFQWNTEHADGQNNPGNDGNQQAHGGPESRPPGLPPGVHRFTYTAGARLLPRDPNNPGPRGEPVDELNNVIVGLMAALGEPPGPHHHDHFHSAGPVPINPLVHLFAQMLPGNGQFGDAVYSQEALDRIITQLMEQNTSSNAPGPAPQSEIDKLPRKAVSLEMLGAEGRAECSICMDEVNIGEEVTELPCHHWFHHACIAAWLGEHDTCPHCRKGITKQPENATNQGQAGGSSGPTAGSSSQGQMPGAFAGGEGTSDNPYVL
ncbi:hypothetical protein M011DRAFT_408773 [Sporormia fimetaria CBS 119925]|uniref:RING-type E3 ubiquitin transferase n=1 Tax=Sporormia fimetaria CBS 119925 TaxID=1340428 RepID=A0A6A6V1N7_9PLEO|nr:hypothetical protein M011DRAFT_408773 [Sporormia fimetaria CBS 119925]